MTINEVISIILAVIFLAIGILLFLSSSKVKEQGNDVFAKYMCYSGFIMFLIAAIFAYISEFMISGTISACLFVISIIFYNIGKKKEM